MYEGWLKSLKADYDEIMIEQ